MQRIFTRRHNRFGKSNRSKQKSWKQQLATFLAIYCMTISLSSVYAQEDEADYALLQELSLADILDIEIISASRKVEKLSEAPTTVMIITDKQIKERGYEYFFDLLHDIPGFDLVHTYGTYDTVFAQRGNYSGAENSKTLVMIDGIVDNNLAEGSVLAGPQYSLHNVKRVEVIYGPASALYGANAFGGIINIITKGANDIDGVEYHAGYGKWNTKYHKILFGKEINGVQLTLSAHIHNSDGPVFKERHPNYHQSYVDDATSLMLKIGNDNIMFGLTRLDRPMGMGTFGNAGRIYAKTDVIQPYGYGLSEGLASGYVQDKVNGEAPTLWHLRTQQQYLKGQYDLTDKLDISGKLFARQTAIPLDSYVYAYDAVGNYADGKDLITRRTYGHEAQMFGAEVKFDYTFSDSDDVIFGFQWERSDIEKGYRARKTDTDVHGKNILYTSDTGLRYLRAPAYGSRERKNFWETNIAGFIQYRKKTEILNSTNFVVGARYDYNDQYGRYFKYAKTFNPRLGIVSEPVKDVIFKVLYGTAYRGPSSWERFSTTAQRMANTSLLPETVQSLEGSLLFKNILSNASLEMTAFLSKFEESIVSNVDTGIMNPATNENWKQNQNAGSTEIKGVELKSNVVFSNSFYGYANATYQKAELEDQFGAVYDIQNIAEWKGNLGITYRFRNMFSVYLEENIVGDRTTSPTNPRKKVDGYALTNLALRWHKIFIKNLSATVTVNNLFDKKWEDPGIRAANGAFYATTHPQPGINGMAKIMLSY